MTSACFAAAFLLMTYLHVTVGEVVPKNLAISTADRLAVVVAPQWASSSDPNYDVAFVVVHQEDSATKIQDVVKRINKKVK